MLQCTLPGIPRALPIVGVERCDPAVSVALFQGEAGVVHPSLIQVDILSIGVGGPDDLRQGLRQFPKVAFTSLQRLLCTLLLSDVLCLNDAIERRALLSTKNRRTELDIDGRTVLTDVTFGELIAGDLPTSELTCKREVRVKIVGMGDRLERESPQLVGGEIGRASW